MTRAFTPPDTLSKDEIRTIADVRRDIWTSAFVGLGVGSLTGIGVHSILQVLGNRGLFRSAASRLNKNTALLAFLGGGALGSFLNATTTGKNEVHLLHDIFQVGSKQQEQQPLHRAQERSDELRQLEERHKNRMLRRKTLQDSLEHGHGLSDSHGGRWFVRQDNNNNQR